MDGCIKDPVHANPTSEHGAARYPVPPWLLPFLPASLGIVVTALFLTMQKQFALSVPDVPSVTAQTIRVPFAHTIRVPLPQVIRDLTLRTSWATALFVSTAMMAAIAAMSLARFYAARPPRWHNAALVLGILVVGWVYAFWPDTFTSAVAPELARLQNMTGFDAEPRLRLFLAGLFCTAWLISMCLGAQLRIADQVPLAWLVNQRSGVRSLLAAATAWLVSGEIGIAILHRAAWANPIGDALSTPLDELGAASSVFAGAYYSTLLAATFGPTELWLRVAARRLAPSSATSDAKSVDAWLTAQGFDFSALRALSNAAMIFAPLVTGVIHGIATFP